MNDLISISPNIWTIIASISSSGIVSAIVSHGLNKRRDKDLEKLKAGLAHGSYVSRSQYDLELGAYQELWSAMSKLRLNVRSLQSNDVYRWVDDTEPNGWYPAAFSSLVESFGKAHNEAFTAADKFAPFYTPEIRQVVASISARDVRILNFIGSERIPTFSDNWRNTLNDHVTHVREEIDLVEDAIRSRLNSLRILP
jgi:hypothetical protein